jgi:hypothetical protein
MLAACGPRAVLGHGATYASAPTSTASNNVDGGPGGMSNAPGASATTASAAAVVATGGSLLDTPIRIVSAPDSGASSVGSDGAPSAGSVGTPSSGIAVVSARSAGDANGGIVISRLPAPHRVAAAEAPAPRTVDDALALIGHRDSRQPLAFALAVAASLSGASHDENAGGDSRASVHPPAFVDGPALVAWAREQGTFRIAGAPMAAGDLLVFDRAVANEPASLVGVALATDARGVTAFLYLARGVVRVGHLDPARPSLARDREGRTVNSYIRHTSDYPPAGTKYLAGELLAGSIRAR